MHQKALGLDGEFGTASSEMSGTKPSAAAKRCSHRFRKRFGPKNTKITVGRKSETTFP